MLAYQYNEDSKEFLNEVNCQKDPLESEIAGKDIWLLPANSTWDKPLEAKDGFKVKFIDGKWQYEAIPEPEPEPEPTVEELQQRVRFVRNSLLAETDCTQLADYPITDSEREQYKAYRSYLRNYTQTEEWYLNSPLTFEEWQE